MRSMIVILVVGAAAGPSAADTIQVPGDAPTIQAGIDLAQTGDVVLVAAGTWSETIDLLGKAITLRATAGPAATIIDGAGTADAVVRCISGETAATTVRGFTITGGHVALGAATGGHGILVNGASPTFRSCRIEGNLAHTGGGAFVLGGAPRFVDCTFEANTASRGAGAAVIAGAAVELDTCAVHLNFAGPGDDCFEANGTPGCASPACTATVCGIDAFCCDVEWDAECADWALQSCFPPTDGGGILVDSASVDVSDSTFTDNTAEFQTNATSKSFGCGGAIAATNATVRVRRSDFVGNASPEGGGIRVAGGSVRLDGVRLDDNWALGGGAIQTAGGTLRVVGSLLVDNLAVFGPGGGVLASSGDVRIVNCTVVGGLSDFGGGLALHPGAVVQNCVVRSNMGGDVVGGPQVRHCNVGGAPPGDGNIDLDPMFVNPAGGDYRLAAGSPCIDAGHDWLLADDVQDVDDDGDAAELLPLDLDGAPRIADDPATPDTGCGPVAVVDMGAHEFAGTPGGPARRGDVNGDGVVDVADLVELILQWGPCPGPCCDADFDVDGAVAVGDLVTLILHWD